MLKRITFLSFLIFNLLISSSLGAELLISPTLALTISPPKKNNFSIAIIKTKDALSYNETTIGYLKYFEKIGYVSSSKNGNQYFKKGNVKIEINEFIMTVQEDDKKTADSNKQLLENIKSKPYNLIVTLGKSAFELIKSSEIKEIPIVFATMFNPYGKKGYDDEEDSNIAGVEMNIPISVQFETLRSFIPYLQNIGVIYSDTPENEETIAEAKNEADKLKFNLIAYKVNDVSEIADSVEKLVKEVDALWMMPDYTVYSEEMLKHIISKTIENGIPFMGASKAYVKTGALFSISWDFKDMGQQAAAISYKIMVNGKHPADFKVQPLQKYPIVINKRTAESIELRIPKWINEKTIEVYD